MSRTYATDEQYERWFKRTCARCGRFGHFAARWPDGHVCRTCHDAALKVRGRCPGCDQERVLPGHRDGIAICTACAGFARSYRCDRCGIEGKLHAGRLCTRCTLADRLADLLGDGTGQIRPELVPLADFLTSMENPLSGLTWLYNKTAADLLRSLGRGELKLTHDALHAAPPAQAAAHLQDLLMTCGLLPAVDKNVLLFERWLHTHLASIDDAGQAQIVRRFATWEVLPRLRARADRKPLTKGSRTLPGDQVKRATTFLGWLTDRGRDLGKCRQADIDNWHVEHGIHDHTAVRAFLQWCAKNKLTRRFDLPTRQAPQAKPLTHQRRLTLLGQVLTNDQTALRVRVAATLVLLYAQPVSRLVRLTIDDVIDEDEQILVRLGEPPSPVPPPFADLLRDYVARRAQVHGAHVRDSPWLFPGRRAGQPLHPSYLAELINQLGVPTGAARAAAIRQQVLEMPPPVVADALGYHPATTTQLAAQAGAAWSRYAQGDHSRLHPPGTRDS